MHLIPKTQSNCVAVTPTYELAINNIKFPSHHVVIYHKRITAHATINEPFKTITVMICNRC